MLLALSSFLHCTHWGSVVILLITSRLIVIENPLTAVVGLVLGWGLSAMKNFWAISSSYPLRNSKNPNQWCLLNISTIGGWRWILYVSLGSLLLNLVPISLLWLVDSRRFCRLALVWVQGDSEFRFCGGSLHFLAVPISTQFYLSFIKLYLNRSPTVITRTFKTCPFFPP